MLTVRELVLELSACFILNVQRDPSPEQEKKLSKTPRLAPALNLSSIHKCPVMSAVEGVVDLSGSGTVTYENDLAGEG